MKRKIKNFIAFFSLLLIGISCSPPQPTEVVARVAGETITVKDLIQAIYREGNKFGDSAFKNSERFQEMKRQLLDELVQKKILAHEAAKQGIAVSEEELEKEIRNYKSRYTEKDFQKNLENRKIDYSTWREIKRENLLIDRFLIQKIFTKLVVSEEELKNYYQQNIASYVRPESVHVRQIVTDSREKAEKILERLKQGENFAKIAHDLSLSPDRMEGGDLGFIYKGTFPKEFEICFSLKVGELSPIVSSIYGFHIFKVLEKQPAEKFSYEEVHDQIEEWLKEQKREEYFEKYYQNLQKEYPVEINQSVLKKVVI